MTRTKFLRQKCRVGGHKAPITQFRAGIAGLLHFVNHLDIAPTLTVNPFDHAPGTGRICDSEHLHDSSNLTISFYSGDQYVILTGWFVRSDSTAASAIIWAFKPSIKVGYSTFSPSIVLMSASNA